MNYIQRAPGANILALHAWDENLFYYVGLSYAQRHRHSHPLTLVRRVRAALTAVRAALPYQQRADLLVILREIRLRVLTGRHDPAALTAPTWGPRDYPTKAQRLIPVCSVDDARAWDWLAAQLRWLLFSQESEEALAHGLPEGGRANLLRDIDCIAAVVEEI